MAGTMPSPGGTMPSPSKSLKMHYLFVGNPGVGKSTIVNCLLGEKLFLSGFSPGVGLTHALQKETRNGIVYMDTPGLADVKLRKQAAEAITEALKQDGEYRIFFVLTEESGRVRPADKATMELILNAAPIGQNYGVIFNKVSKNAILQVEQNEETKDKILATLFANCEATNFVHFLEKSEFLDDANDAFVELPEGVKKFIENMPPIVIKPEQVTEISGSDFENLEAKYEKMITMMEDNNKALAAQIGAQSRQMEAQNRQLEAQAKESAELRQQLLNMQPRESVRNVPVPVCSMM